MPWDLFSTSYLESNQTGADDGDDEDDEEEVSVVTVDMLNRLLFSKTEKKAGRCVLARRTEEEDFEDTNRRKGTLNALAGAVDNKAMATMVDFRLVLYFDSSWLGITQSQ
jgi:hypothetical protein